MTDAQAEQLLEFVRNEVIPLLLARSVAGGAQTMKERLEREYPDLDLFPAS